MAPVLKTMPGKVSARGRKKRPKKGRSGSSRRKSTRSSMKSVSSKGKRGKGKKRRRRKMISPEQYGEMVQELKTCRREREMLEIKLTAMTHSRQQYRKCSFSLLDENEEVHRRLIKVEKECIEVVGYLRQKRGANEARLEVVEKELAEVRQVEDKKRKVLAESYEAKIKGLSDVIRHKDSEIDMLQYEVQKLKVLKDTNMRLENENEDIRKELLETMVRHQNQLVEYEVMIMKEKKNLEQLARTEVHNLVDKAHEMAAINVGATTADVYNQNHCLNLTLHKYQQEVRGLEAAASTRSRQLEQAQTRAVLAEAALRQLRRQLTSLQLTAKELQERLVQSEDDRLQEVVSLQEVRAELRDWALHEREQDQRQAQQLRRQLALKEATVRRLRQLARRVLARRSQLEDFFLSALDHVTGEAAVERRGYWRDAERRYRQQMADGLKEGATPPEVMTLDGSRTSSCDIGDGWRQHNAWSQEAHQVDVASLTWLQKESVLRVLFAHINGVFGKVRRQKREKRPRKKTADVGVQKFGGHKRSVSGQGIGGYPVLSPYMDKSVQMLNL